MNTFKNGRITVTENSIQIKNILGSSVVIQKHDITNIDISGNFIMGIIACAFIFGAINGIRMLRGYKAVKITYGYGKEIEFWVKKNEASQLVTLL